jgi:hypothetical protein
MSSVRRGSAFFVRHQAGAEDLTMVLRVIFRLGSRGRFASVEKKARARIRAASKMKPADLRVIGFCEL